MMIRSKLFSLFLALVLLFSLFPAPSLAEDSGRSFTDSFEGSAYTVRMGTYYAYGGLYSSASTYLPYFYSDGYFAGSSAERNSHLATMSFNLAIAATHSGGVGDRYNHAVIRKLLAEIGCDEKCIFVNDMSLRESSGNSTAFALAHKTLQLHTGEFTLLPIAIRGGGYGDDEWVSNVTMGTEGEAEGFRAAAETVWTDLIAYLDKWELTEAAENGKLKFWPVGYSRGGAIANLVAKRLVDSYGTDSVYGYTFEAPTAGLAASDTAAYDCIHNYVNYADLVPLIPPAESGYGFTRYGEDFVFPAKDGYDSALLAMKAQLDGIDPYSDYIKANNAFRLHYLNLDIGDYLSHISDLGIDDIMPEISYNYASYDGNSIYFVGHFLRAFITELQNSRQTWGLYNRAQYAENKFSLNGTRYPYTIQEAAAGLIAALMNADADLFPNVANQFQNYLSGFGTMDYLSLVSLLGDLKDGLKYWNDGKVRISLFSTYDDSDRKALYNDLWNHVKKSGALDVLRQYGFDVAFFENVVPVLFCTLMSFAALDNNTKANAYPDGLGFRGVSSSLVLLGTAISNYQLVEINHEYWPNLAWVRSYDSYYTMKGVPSSSKRPSRSPAAPVVCIGEHTASSASDVFTAVLCGDEVLLDAPLSVGETIYYDVYDLTNGKSVASDQLYYASVPLPENEGGETNYRITASAYCDGVLSGVGQYYVKSVPSCRISSADIAQNGIRYEVDSNYSSADKVIVMAAAYEQGKLAQVTFSDPFPLSSAGNSGTLPLLPDEKYSYRLFIVGENGYAPLCPGWCSTAA